MAKRTRLTANDLEYRRIRKNLRAQLRYREKQGFKVDYTTLPKQKTGVTKRDIETISKYRTKINMYGEVVSQGDKRKVKQFRDITKQDVLTSKEILKRANNGTDVNPQYSTHKEQISVDMDYIGMVYGAMSAIKEKAEQYITDDDPLSYSYQSERFYEAFISIFEYGISLVDSEVDSKGEQRVNAYYKRNFSRISEEIGRIITLEDSEPDRIAIRGMAMLEFVLRVS